MALYAGIDVGTSGGRCIVVDDHGNRVAYGEHPWNYIPDDIGFPTLEPATAIAALHKIKMTETT